MSPLQGQNLIFRKMADVWSKNHTAFLNNFHGENAEYLNVKEILQISRCFKRLYIYIVTCSVLRVTKITDSSSDDWIY
jgi:hypothetical protein